MIDGLGALLRKCIGKAGDSTLSDAVPGRSVWRKMVRMAAPLGALAAVMTPAAASASDLCTAINAGKLDFQTTYANAAVTSTGARFNNSTNQQTISSLRADQNATGPAGESSAFDTPTAFYGRFIAGERVTFDFTVTGFSGSLSLSGALSRGTSASSGTSAGATGAITSNTSGSFSYTADGTETYLRVLLQKTGSSVNGTIKADLTCTAVAPPTITGISPPSISTAGGSITINGNNLTGVDTVSFDTTNVVPTSVGANAVVVTAPAHAAGTVSVIVRNGQNASAPFTFTYVPPAPVVSSVSPSSGGLGQASNIVLRGTNLTGATAVKFGGVNAVAFTVGDDTTITATAPAATTPGTVAVVVTTAGGPSDGALGYRYYVPVTNAAAFAPAAVAAGASSTLTFTLSNPASNPGTMSAVGFSSTIPANLTLSGAATTCTGGTVTGNGSAITLAGASIAAGGTCTVTASASATSPGSYTITPGAASGQGARPNADLSSMSTVTGPAGVAQTLTVTQPAPVATAQSVTVAYNTATPITLSGTNAPTSYAIATNPTNGVVSLNGSTATYTPTAGYIGADSFTFTATNGTGTSAPATVSITVSPPPAPAAPAVTAPTPNQRLATTTPVIEGTTASGTTVTVFIDGASRGAANVSGTAWSLATASNPLSQGSHTVYAIAANAGGDSSPSPTINFVVDTVPPAAPTIASPAQNANVTSATPAITGIAEAGASVRVTVDGVAGAPVTADGSGNFSYTSPTLAKGAHTAGATATDAAGNVSPTSAQRNFTYYSAPAITSVAPAQGTTAGGQQITITGSGFTGVNAATGVTVGGTPATSVNVANDGQITAFTPGGTAGATTVTVQNAAGQASIGYTYLTPPTASPQSVTTAYQTPKTITLAGTNATSYTVTQPANGAGTVALSGSGPNATYTPPAGYRGTTSFTYYTTNGTGPGAPQSAAATITVTVQGPAPVVSTVSPNFGPTAGGTTITIDGSSFTGVTGVTVGGSPATNVAFVSDSQLRADTPAGTGGSAAVVVSNAAGAGNGNVTFNYVAPPTANAQAVSTAFNAAKTITLTATDPQGRALTYNAQTTSTRGGTITLSGATATYTPPANATGVDDFTFTASNGVNTSSPATITVTIGKGAQTITFNTAAPAGARSGGATYTVGATASSGLPVGFAIDAAATGVCSISGTTVSFTASGQCVINADQAGDATYDPAPQRQLSFAVGKATQTLQFDTAAPGNAAVGGATYTPAATASSGLPVAFTIAAGSSGVCSLSNGAVSFTAAGTCTINADQAGNASYDPAPQVQQSFAVGAGAQSVSFTSTPPANAAVNGPGYTVAATASSGLPVSFAIAPAASGICTLSGTTVSFTGVGTCTVTASQAGNANYQPASQNQSFAVGKAAQTIAFNSAAPGNAAVGGATYTPAATASSGLPVAFTIAAGSSGVCSLSNGAVSFTAAGTCTINADQAGNGTYNAAPQVQQSFAVGAGAQSVSFTSTPPASAAVNGPGYTVAATASSGLPVSFAIAPAASGICTLSGTTVSFTGVGTCTVTASQAGNANYQPASQNQSFAVGKAAQTIAFNSAAPGNAAVGGATYTPAATASSGLPVAFTIAAGSSGVCSLNNGAVSFTAAGTCTINADQAGNASYDPAPQVQQSFAVGAGAQSVSFTSTPPASAAVNGPGYTVAATASSGLPVSFAIAPAASGICTLSGTTVSFTGVGTCTVTASQAGNANYQPASQNQSFAVGKAAQTIAFNSAAPGNAAVGGATYTPAATASSGLPVAFTIAAGSSGVCSLTNGAVSFTAAGTCTINADQAGNGTYNAAPQVQQNVTVTRGAQTITFTSTAPANATAAGATYTVSATASSGRPVAFTIDATATGVCTVSGNSVAFLRSGTCVINANEGGDANYNAAAQAQQSFAVGAATIAVNPATIPPATTRIDYSQQFSATGGTPGYTFAVTGGALPAGFTLSSSGVLSGRTNAPVSANFTVTATDQYGNPGSRQVTLTVNAPGIVLSPQSLPAPRVGVAYSQTLTATGGTGPYSFAVTGGALPTGLTLAAGGALTGTPTAGGSFNVTVTATDANGNVGALGYTLNVAQPTIAIAPAALPDATTRIGYSQTISAAGGTAPYSYAVTAGQLPSGLTLTPSGLLSGSAAAPGSYNFTITARDASTGAGPYSAAQSYTLTVRAPAITIAPAALPDATTRVAYNQTLTASGGTGPYSYAVTAGQLPSGLTLTSGGVLSGTASAPATANFTVTATDANGNVGNQSYTLRIVAPAIVIAPDAVPGAVQYQPYSQQLSATGGAGGYGFAVTAGALPPGFGLSTAGVLAGPATAAGTFNFTVTVTDSNGNVGSRGYAVQVVAPTIALAPTTLTAASVGSGYAATITASGGVAPYSFAVTAGALPTGLTLQSSGALAGTPTRGGTANFTITATDANGNVGNLSYTLTVNAAAVTLAPAQLPAGTAGTAYDQTLTAAGGTAPYSFAVTAGALPGGLTLATGGRLSGSPATGGSFTFTVTATDSSTGAGPYRGAQSYTLTIGQQAQTITFANPGDKRLSDSPVTLTATASSGLAVTYASTTSAICTVSGAQVTLAATGTCTIVASQAGNASYAAASDVTQSFRVDAALLVATVAQANVAATVGAPLSAATPVTAAGGAAPYAFALSRALPAGLVYSPTTGQLSGTATAGQAATGYTVTVTDASGQTATGQFTLTVAAPTVVLAPTTLPNARQTIAYSQQLSATGGTAPYSYAVTAGALPNGLTLSAGGLISGTPSTSAVASDFTVTVTDSSTGTGPFRGSQSYRLAVDLPPPPVIEPVPPATTAGTTTAASTPIRIALSDYVRGEYTDLEISSPPANGTVTLARSGGSGAGGGITTLAGPRVVATYTPRQGFSGTDSFSFVAVGPGGRSNPAAVTINVVGQAPVVTPLTAATTQGVPVTVDLTATATGGPFTAARVVSVTPAGSLQTQLVEGGSAGNRTYRLTITPTLSYSGNAVLTYGVSNAFGETTATVTIAVAARPDPSSDPTVNGLSTAQADATRRFAQAQIQNFARRNEQLHNGGNGSGGFQSGMTLSGGDPARQVAQANESDFMLATLGNAREVAGSEYANGTLVRPGEGGMVGLAGGRGRAAAAAAGQPGDVGADAGPDGRRVGSVAIWTGGAIAIGTRDRTTQRDKLSVTTGGLSSGIDVKLSDTLVVGIGGGYGADRTKLDEGRAKVTGDAWSIAGYGSWSPTRGLFIDGVFGGGQLDFDTRRLVSQTNSVATGNRDGNMLFGSLAAGFDRNGDRFDLALYGRVDWMRAELDRYTENGGGIYGLTFGERDLTSVQGVLGGRLRFPLGLATGSARGEWRHEFNGTADQLIDYADVVNLRYRTRGDRFLRDAFALDLGVDSPLGRGWSGGVAVGVTGGSGAVAGTGKVELRKQFR